LVRVITGLASSIFSNDMREVEHFLSMQNRIAGLSTSICGAFGGQKETGGGGRDAGSDIWKSYMRSVTSNHQFRH
jgi:aldehyde dehydrogenase (NAD+)